MVKLHKYNTRYKKNYYTDNNYLLDNNKLLKKSSKKSSKNLQEGKINLKNNNNNHDNSDDNSDDDSDDDSDINDFIVSDSKSIEYNSSYHLDSDNNSGYNSESNSESDSEANSETDSEANSRSDSESNSESCSKSGSKSDNKYKYAKFLNKLFPSNYSKDKIKDIKRQRLLSPTKYKQNFNNIIYIDRNMLDRNNYYKIYDNYHDNESYENESHENESHENESHENESHENESHENESYENESHENEYCNSESETINRSSNIFLSDKYSSKNKNNKDDKNMILDNKKQINKNYKEYKNIFNKELSKEESNYFKNVLTLDDQIVIIDKLKSIKQLTTIKKPYLIHLVDLDIPEIYKACAINKINLLSNMDENSGNSEYYKLKSWIESFIKIPFNSYSNIPIHINDGLDKCNQFITEAKYTLDSCVFGLEKAKIQILQLIGLWMVNPNSIGTSISLKGPMGVGKTTLIKDGISKILNRYFELIPLGGSNDISYFEGHGYTYEGSTYGKIIDILIQSKQMNPIIYFDELDKVSETPKGDEIIGLLTHLTDTTQNNCFHDKYFSEIDFDLSKVLYIFSYNDDTRINPILRDRMYNIELTGYNVEDKISISKEYILPKIRENIKFNKEDIIFTDEVIKYIINKYTYKEEGVRNLKRCYEIIYSKLNLLKLLKSDNEKIYKLLNISNNITLPVILDIEIIDKLLYKKQEPNIPFGIYN